jgi:hypothetical protein
MYSVRGQRSAVSIAHFGTVYAKGRTMEELSDCPICNDPAMRAEIDVCPLCGRPSLKPELDAIARQFIEDFRDREHDARVFGTPQRKPN